ncbi:CbtA family protein [archaeon]|nr:CbtA family protein [archaeon]
MKTFLFIIIVLLSGASAGLIHGMVNFVIVEPYLDQAIGIENQNLFESGDEEDTPQFWAEYEGYRDWQKSGQILAGVILGISMGSLFGIVFSLSRNSLMGSNDVKKSVVLACMMWFALVFIPFLKYPANPPTVGDGDTVVLRSILYLSFVAISGLGVVLFYWVSRKLEGNKKFVALIGYSVFIVVAFVAMPANPDEITAPMSLVNEFRLMSILGISSFWISVGIISGLLWHRFEPYQKTTDYS